MIKVNLTDENLSYKEGEEKYQKADLWAQNLCTSYKGYTVNDVSDFSATIDTIATFEFTDEKEAAWFKLRWV